MFPLEIETKNLSAITGKNRNGGEICWNVRFLFIRGEGGPPPLSLSSSFSMKLLLPSALSSHLHCLHLHHNFWFRGY